MSPVMGGRGRPGYFYNRTTRLPSVRWCDCDGCRRVERLACRGAVVRVDGLGVVAAWGRHIRPHAPAACTAMPFMVAFDTGAIYQDFPFGWASAAPQCGRLHRVDGAKEQTCHRMHRSRDSHRFPPVVDDDGMHAAPRRATMHAGRLRAMPEAWLSLSRSGRAAGVVQAGTRCPYRHEGDYAHIGKR